MRALLQIWRDRLHAIRPLTRVNAVVLVLVVFLFLAIANEVAEGEHFHIEQAIMESFRTGEPARPVGPPWLIDIARDITSLGSVAVLTTATVLVVGFLWLTRRFGAAIFLICASGGGQSLNAGLKAFYDRERPDPAFRWMEIHSPSFPSGHATSSAVVYLALAVLLARLTDDDSHKAYIIGSALVLSFLVGLTRVYLGVHYPTDVIAGWAVGIVWAQCCWFATYAIGRRRLARTS